MEEEALRAAMEDAFLEGAVQWRADTILQTLRMDKLDAWIRGEGLSDDIEALKSEIDEVKATVSDVKGRAIGNRRLARSLAALKQKLFDADDAIDELDYYRLLHQVEGGQHLLPSSSNTHNCFASDDVTQPCTPAAMTTPVTLQEPEGMHEVAQLDHGTLRGDDNILPRSGRGKKRSKAWDDFEDIRDDNGKTVQAECRHCKKRVQYKGAQGTRVLITHVNSAECKNTREARPQTPSHSTWCPNVNNNAEEK
ncbi:uncharacterized protein LOC119362464 isoform X2 [Triticum dicoccoides]|uniref:uncharacterized protein LOC119362464 isoform X2 n=1 Tax=Triticum dicoccoides TaxID=85692 RepID=UPI001890B41F|nr:uncharacterized protein LOC119362464 isoform X2 [Triticum dicoccoides]